ncbi:MAG: hypothetical protein HY820_16765 [Acidobacteria bacterium]|nr:hypothetical protein [Acidobacteriota bacterium]
MSQSCAVLFTARYKWPFRLVAVIGVVLLAILRPSVIGMWRESGWFFGGAVVVTYVVVVGAVMETFLRQTWLTNEGIHQRSMFGQVRFIPYGQVQELVIERDEALLVKYQNGRRLKVHAKEASPEAIIEAARPFLSPEIRVITL